VDPYADPDFYLMRMWIRMRIQVTKNDADPDPQHCLRDNLELCNDQVEHWNLTRYLNMVLESDWHDDTDVARHASQPLHLPSLEKVFFLTPFQLCFDKNKSKIVTSRAPRGPKDFKKL
jgi:hypothetical protein